MLTVTQPPVESSLAGIARALVADGRGILAADESLPTIEKRFRTIDVESTEEARRSYRELLFTAPDVEQYISGVILFDGTTHQVDASGTPLVDVLTARGIIPGVKVDRGAKPLAGSPRETVTEGLDGLRERLHDYHERGLRFTKWRAVIAIGDGLPTPYCIRANADALARYAALSQEEGLVPIVEPEVLIDGDHTIERCYDVTEATLHYVFDVLHQHRVDLDAMLLKPNMVLSGKSCPDQATVEVVADMTVRCLLHSVPAAVPGIVFLSGGQTSEQATERLSAMNARAPEVPWQLSFSYGRALQEAPLNAWRGDPANTEAAQRVLCHRARLNGAARYGRYEPEMEGELEAVPGGADAA